MVDEYTDAWLELGFFFITASYFCVQARVSGFKSQYQPSVKYKPCAVFKPMACTSVININKAAKFCFLVKPNSAAALMLLTVSPPALAKPTTLAPELCACNKKEEKSPVDSG